MANVQELQNQFTELLTTLYREALLDGYFKEILGLSEVQPDFLVNVVTVFFTAAEEILNNLARILEGSPVDFTGARKLAVRLKNSGACLGASSISNSAAAFTGHCDATDSTRCLQCLEDLKSHYSRLKDKLDTLVKLHQQILAADGSIPEVEC